MDIEPWSFLIAIIIDWGLVWGFILLIMLLICSALVSGSEVAFFSLDKNQLKQIEEEDSSSGNRILSLREKPRRLLATILITNNLVNIGIVILAYYLFQYILPGDTLFFWGQNVSGVPFMSWLDTSQWALVIGCRKVDSLFL